MVIAYFHPMRMTDAILPGSPPLGNIKGCANHFSLPHWPAAGQSQPTWQSTHSLFSLPSSRKDHPTWETTLTLLHWLSLTYFEWSTKHHEKTSFNLWTIGVWEIHSSFLLNQQILGEINWTFSTPVLTSAF